MTTEKKAEKALLMAGYSGSLYRCIATSQRPGDAVQRLAGALTVTPAPEPKEGEGRGRPTLSIDGNVVKQVVLDYYAKQKTTDEITDAIADSE